jgi:hypothetical protein
MSAANRIGNNLKFQASQQELMPAILSLQDSNRRMNPRSDWVDGDKSILFEHSQKIRKEINLLANDNKLKGSKIHQMDGSIKKLEKMILLVGNMTQGVLTEETLS